MPPSHAVQHAPCPPLGAILYAGSGEPLLDDSDVAAHAHLQHCAACQRTVADAQADVELVQSVIPMRPWWVLVRELWVDRTIRQRVYLALAIPRLLLFDLRTRVVRWRHDLAYGIRCVRARRALASSPPPKGSSAARESDERKARFLADIREAHLLAACRASRGASARTPRPDRCL